MTEREHPSLTHFREEHEAALAQGYTEGDVNHFTQPVIGVLRMRQHKGEPVTDEDITWAVERLTKACRAEVAWLEQMKVKHESR